MKRTTIVIRACVAVVFVAVTFLWLRELTQRRARHAADLFMGPLLTQVGCDGLDFVLLEMSDLDGKRSGPRWHVRYDSQYPGCFIDPPLTIHVDLMGRVRSANYRRLFDLISLSEEQRWNREAEMRKEAVESDGRAWWQ